MGRVYIQLFGSLRIQYGEHKIRSFGTEKNTELLAYLAHYRAHPQSREVLVELFWSEIGSSPKYDKPLHNLSQALHTVRKRLGDHGILPKELLLCTRHDVQLNPNLCTTDVAEFEAILAKAQKASLDERIVLLQKAVRISEQEFQKAVYSEWANTERNRLTGLREEAIEQLEQLKALPTLSAVQREGAGATVLSAEHEQVPAVAVRYRLPASRKRFFGRHKEIKFFLECLDAPEGRLITLTGMGGIGKSHLALEMARRAEDAFEGNVLLVPLADIQEANLIPRAILYALGIRGDELRVPLDGIYSHLQGRKTLLVLDNLEHLANDSVPILTYLLDRLPQLVILATSRVPLHIIGEQEVPIRSLPMPDRILPLNQLLENEAVGLLRDRIRLKNPNFEVTERNEQSVLALCRRLEGIPLSLELAAGQGRTKTLQQMLEGVEKSLLTLEGRPNQIEPRHLSLRAVLQWTYETLTPDQQKFFSQLSVFRDSWSEKAAGVLAIPTAEIYLDQLVDSSLIWSEEEHKETKDREQDAEMRFRMLAVVHEFASEQLSPEEVDNLAHEHAQYFLAFGAEWRSQLGTSQEEAWLNRIERDRANFYAALERTAPHDRTRTTRDLLSSLGYLWVTRHLLEEGLSVLTRILPGVSLPLMRAAILNTIGSLASEQGAYEEAESAYLECLQIAELTQNPDPMANALGNLGLLAWNRINYRAARRYLELSLPWDLKIGLARNICLTRLTLGLVAAREGEFTEARMLLQQNLDQAQEAEDVLMMAWSLGNLAQVARLEGNLSESEGLCRQSLMLLKEIKNEIYMVTMLEEAAYILHQRGAAEESLRLLGLAQATRQKHRVPLAPVDRIDYDACLAAIRQEVSPETVAGLLAEGSASSVEAMVNAFLQESGST